MPKTIPEQNDAVVLEAFDALFNTLDYRAAERFWSPKYIQHSAHKAPGRDGLFALIRSAPQTLRYENQLIVAEGDYVMSHGRFSGIGRSAAWVVLHAHECLGHSAPPQSQGRIAWNTAVAVLHGTVQVNGAAPARGSTAAGAVFTSKPLLSGEPIREPVVGQGPS
jgi:predicted SnoaL-like aldol condensation-catalyzing enzyme